MTRENITIVDGQMYRPDDEIWDLGSFVATSAQCRKRNYEGLSKDVEKLPHYVDTGSSAFCLDTGDFYKFLRSTDTWYKINCIHSLGGGNDGAGVHDYKNLSGKPQINGITLQDNLTTKDLGIKEFSGEYNDLQGRPETLPNPHALKFSGLIPEVIYDGSKDVNITLPNFEMLNESAGTPVGEIISYMGNTAPVNYIACDGAEYNISDYEELANHFIKEFGQVNYFGGDGETTFAVPDLRGEFLRGTGTSTKNYGEGANVGIHQDPTCFPMIVADSDGIEHVSSTTKNDGKGKPKNIDKSIKNYTTQYVCNARTALWDEGYNKSYHHYTSRPTNTAILYCIKSKHTHYIKDGTNLSNTLSFNEEGDLVVTIDGVNKVFSPKM